jgi:hypothetical protein
LYKQTVARKQPPSFIAIPLIIAGVFVIYFVGNVLVYLGIRLGFPYLQYAVYALLIAAGVFVMRNWLTSYRYALSESELLVEKWIGKRVRAREVAELSAILSFGEYDPAEKPEGGTLLYAYKTKGAKALGVRANGTRYLILIQPDEELTKRLSDSVRRESGQNADQQSSRNRTEYDELFDARPGRIDRDALSRIA